MKINVDVWIDWYGQNIISPERHREIVNEALTSYYEDEWLLDEFLDDNYSRLDLLNMDEFEKDRVLERYREYCEEKYSDDDEYVEETIEVEIDETELRHLLRII